MSRTTRSLILDDDIWDALHNSWMEEQLTSGERLTKTDFVERVFRLGLSAASKGRAPRRPGGNLPTLQTDPPHEPLRRSVPASDSADRRHEQPATIGTHAGASADVTRPPQLPPSAPPAASAVARPPTRKRSLDRLMNMSQVADPSQISSAADRRSSTES